ncbi:MAG: hypothetical protein WKF50_07305 [Nocardioides sp.]
MTWNAHQTRGEILREVSAVADARRDGELPLDVDGVRQAFADELDLLGALQLRWHTRLAGEIDRTLMSQPLDLEQAVVTAWRASADELPGIRAIVDRHRDHPLDDAMAHAMAVATRKEHAWLAVMAGQAGISDAGGARVGARIEEKARAGHQPTRSTGAHAAPGLIGRLMAALAA